MSVQTGIPITRTQTQTTLAPQTTTAVPTTTSKVNSTEYVGVHEVRKPMSTDNSKLLTAIIVIAFVSLLIMLVIIGVYFWSYRNNVPPKTCAGVADCSAGYYCSHSGTCITGGGASEGQPCSTNDNCIVGLYCTSGLCSSNPSPGPSVDFSVIATPGQFSFCVDINCMIYQIFLPVHNPLIPDDKSLAGQGMFLIPTILKDGTGTISTIQPYYFEYKATNYVLEWVACSDTTGSNPWSVGIIGDTTATFNGSPFAATGNAGEQFYLQGSQQYCFIRHPCGNVMTTLQRSTQPINIDVVTNPTTNPPTVKTLQGYNLFFPNVDQAHCTVYPAGHIENVLSFQVVQKTC